MEIGRGVFAVRGGHHDDERSSGLDGGGARATGDSASITYAAPPSDDAPGWRAQVWLRDTNLENFTTAPGPGRLIANPANDQYATPAFGWGANAALRGQGDAWEWELGADARFADGETRERFRFIAPDFTRNRVAGGENVVAGLYGEASWRSGAWLLAGGARLDYWSSNDARRLETDLATDAVTLAIGAPDRDGYVPTARIGARYDVSDAVFARAAAYAGFRPPTLNELHRPFRVANDITEANPLLKPEKLYGVEAALGNDGEEFSWQATLFYNVLKDPIANVTIATAPGNATVFFGPESFDVFVPAGGVLRQRQNAGRIDAVGLEAEALRRWGDDFALRVALNITSARVDGGDTAPQLTGNRPAQAPRVTITAGADWRIATSVVVHGDLRFESARFDDDLNTRRLDSAFTTNLRADWRISDTLALYAEALNVTDADVETAKTADGIASLDQPRTFWVGLTFTL
jgi:outer membrane receptor protein involved in Fe transport